MRVRGGAAPGEFMHVGRTDDDGSGALQPLRHIRVILLDPILQDSASGRHPLALDTDIRLYRDGNPMKRPKVASIFDKDLMSPGKRQRFVLIHVAESNEVTRCFLPVKAGLNEIDDAQVACTDPSGSFSDR
jgi:hypothetical protein